MDLQDSAKACDAVHTWIPILIILLNHENPVKNFRTPLTTCILLSVVLTLVLWLVRR